MFSVLWWRITVRKSNKVLFTVLLQDSLRDELDSFFKENNFEVDYFDEKKEIKIPDLEKYDIMISYNPFVSNDFRGAVNLKLLIMASTGIDHVPDYMIEKNNLVIANNYGGYAVPISEWILMSALMGIKNVPKIIERAENKIWGIEKNMMELTDKEVLILGAGRIASEASKRFRCFNAKVRGYRKSTKENPDFDEIIGNDKLDSSIKKSDIVVMCLPETPETYQILDDKRLSMMKDDAILINISRGKTIDEQSLIKHLEKGKFRFVALDVFENEPLSKESPLWDIDRVFISTHTCWMSQKRGERIVYHIKKSLSDFLKTGTVERPADKVNRY